MNVVKTKEYYELLRQADLCDCAYCQNYTKQIKTYYPQIAQFLQTLGVDIEKPFETGPLELDEDGQMLYISPQYIVLGESAEFNRTTVNGNEIAVTEQHPGAAIQEDYFVIDISPVRLPWRM